MNDGFLLLQSSATTNETLSHNSDIPSALKSFCPSIQDADIRALITVCKPILGVKVFNFVIQAYPVSSFVSADLQLQTVTGDVQFRCAVSLDHCLPFRALRFPLARDNGRRVWQKWYLLGLSVQPENSHVWGNGCWACR